MRKSNDGRPAQREFERIIAALGKRAYLHRFDDAAAIRGLTGAAGYAKKQPSDYLLTMDGVTSFTEVKSSADGTSFSFSMLEEGQVAAARKVIAAGGRYLVLAFSIRHQRWFQIEFQEIAASERRSIKWTEMRPWNV